MKKEFVYKEFLRKEENILRAPYNPELEFYAVIKSGDIKKTKALCEEPLTKKKGLGVLSHNPLQNMRYHFAITIALIARYCIEGGMDVSTSYALSDFIFKRQMSVIVLRNWIICIKKLLWNMQLTCISCENIRYPPSI